MQISIHAPARGASFVRSFFFASSDYFNSRPCERGFLFSSLSDYYQYYFNSRPCERGFILGYANPNEAIKISIHAPARGASSKTKSVPYAEKFQFTPLREGLPSNLSMIAFCLFISIHAPARGASFSGCTLDPVIFYFNSRPCERGFPVEVGILFRLSDFNSRPCERGFSWRRYGRIWKRFQFTPLREGLQTLPESGVYEYYFNSRPCERGFSKNHQFLYRLLLFFYSINTFSQN